MATQQYCDYIAQANARAERAQQLTRKYNQRPEHKKQTNLWMHDIERHEAPYELRALAVIGAVLVLGALVIGLYYAGR